MKAGMVTFSTLLAPLTYVLLAPATAATPQERVFTVGNYPVEAVANNAVAAKDKAIAEGQQAAFRSLLKRIVPVTGYNRLDRLKSVRASEYLEGFAVRSEQNSATQYIASLDFSFQPDEVRNLLAREGVPFIESQAELVTLIPVLRDANAEGTFRPATGDWANVWKGLDLENTLTPIEVAPLRSIIHSDTINMAIAGDENADRILSGEYRSERIIIALAETDAASEKLTVTLVGRDGTGYIHWTRSYRIGGGDVGYTMELAAVVSLGVLEGRWKAAGHVANGEPGSISAAGPEIFLTVAFASRDEWNEIRGRILEVDGIDDIRVGNVTGNSAELSLRYPGGGDALSAVLAPRGLSLSYLGGGWQLRSSY